MELYKELGITPELETRLLAPSKDFKTSDWLKIIELRDCMLEINKSKTKPLEITQEDENRVAQERKEHKNKRFNVRKNWLPLH